MVTAMPQLRSETSVTDLQHFFEYSAAGVEVLADGLQEIPFGEFLVERNVLTMVAMIKEIAWALEIVWPRVSSKKKPRSASLRRISLSERSTG